MILAALGEKADFSVKHTPCPIATRLLALNQGKTMLGSIRLRAEQAIQIADIGYFKIAAGNHRQYI